MKRTQLAGGSSFNTIDEKSINSILDNGINQLSLNHSNTNNYTYALNKDIPSSSSSLFSSSLAKGKEKSNSIVNPFIAVQQERAEPLGRESPRRDQMMEQIDYRQQLICCQNELHSVKKRLNDEMYGSADLRRQLESNNRLLQEKDYKIADQLRQITSLGNLQDDYMKLKHDYNQVVVDLCNSERIRNEQKQLITALQKDMDAQRQRAFEKIDQLNRQKGVIELEDVNSNNSTQLRKSGSKSTSQGKSKRKVKKSKAAKEGLKKEKSKTEQLKP